MHDGPIRLNGAFGVSGQCMGRPRGIIGLQNNVHGKEQEPKWLVSLKYIWTRQPSENLTDM